jgi:CheY-like chemotaxis protein
MGSEIYLKSRENEGSTFTFELILPVAPEVMHSTTELMAKMPNLSGKRILVVDDNRVNVMVAAKLLKRWNAVIDSAENGEDAYHKVQKENYDLILMDIQMPVMDGYEATRAIRNLKGDIYQKVPIIALTATVLEEVEKKVKEVGLDGILTKPIRPDELKRRISEFLTLHSPAMIKKDDSEGMINVK